MSNKEELYAEIIKELNFIQDNIDVLAALRPELKIGKLEEAFKAGAEEFAKDASNKPAIFGYLARVKGIPEYKASAIAVEEKITSYYEAAE